MLLLVLLLLLYKLTNDIRAVSTSLTRIELELAELFVLTREDVLRDTSSIGTDRVLESATGRVELDLTGLDWT